MHTDICVNIRCTADVYEHYEYCVTLQARGGGEDTLIRGGVVHVVLTALCYRRGEEAGGLLSGDAAIEAHFCPLSYLRLRSSLVLDIETSVLSPG
jgi:hypothetical protein